MRTPPRSAAAASSQADAVTILTIHGSKGLEYPVVWVAECAAQFKDKDLHAPILFDHALGAAACIYQPKDSSRRESVVRMAIRERLRVRLTEEEMQTIVAQWRAASPTIPRFWRDTENAAKRALESPGRPATIPCGVRYIRDRDALRCRLPSGRVLTYWGARLDKDGKICFMGQNQTTRKWEKTETWGGKLVENIVQAFARDCLAVALLRIEKAGFRIVFHVHDEVVVEAPEGTAWEEVAEIMGRPIKWAPGLLLRGDGYETKFYMKD